ncbi:PREDICTED: uncharacterized protein LOC108766337 isoform X2 [Trachymyrmex cornetzi]|uniref:uncharacterized protein LOC108766337 isoform X2 n=1 Tax=Trachymyrmex cornetzi TaxID=471704 RepID=UPI00084F32A9|nr:PREDICTED: uncharacterized protein LOC108766337 isoform X2 [Trachymyrmex cornetzi]XP_018371068.1 PREDICTED: uncharacterized protein LOC108766337 isoform X2 [Trachymyrmex cornetzi]
MPVNEPDAEIFERDQSQYQVVNGARHEENDRMLAKQEVINENGKSWISPISETITDSVGTRGISPSRTKELPELSRTTSRTEAVRQDVRRLKSATLDRMGKMFKARTPAAGRSFLGLNTNITSVDNEKTSRNEKTNSLGRMFKLVDKDGSPRKLFVHSRAVSLSRILRRNPHNENNGIIDKPAEDTGRGILSRMFNQLRGRSVSGTTTKPDEHKHPHNKLDSSLELSSEMPLNSKTTNIM